MATPNQYRLLDILETWGGHGTIEVEIQWGEYAPKTDAEDDASGFRTTRLVVAGLMRSLVRKGWATDDHDGYGITEAGVAALNRQRERTVKV